MDTLLHQRVIPRGRLCGVWTRQQLGRDIWTSQTLFPPHTNHHITARAGLRSFVVVACSHAFPSSSRCAEWRRLCNFLVRPIPVLFYQ